jgi:mannosyltransferase
LTTTLPDVESESTISDPPSSRSRLRARVATTSMWLVPTLATLVIGRFRAGRVQFHPDEAVTLGVAHRSVDDIVRLAGNIDGVIAPYYLFMHFWIRLFGDSEAAMRIPSIVAIAAGVGLTTILGKRLFNERVGFLAGLILAIVPGISYYAQTARAYGFTLFAGALCSLALLRAFDRASRGRWIGYALTVTLMAYAHIAAAALLLAAHGVLAALCWYRDRNRAALGWIVAVAGGLLPAAPLLWVGAREHDRQLSWIPPPTLGSFFPQLGSLMYLDAGVAGLLFGLALAARWPRRRNLVFVAVLAVLPQVVLVLAGLFTNIWLPRYHFFALAFLALLAAVALARSVSASAGALVLLTLIGLSSQVGMRAPVGQRFTDYQTMVKIVQDEQRPGDAIAYQHRVEWALRPLFESKLPPARRPIDALIAATPAQAADIFATPCPDTDACLRGIDRIWLIYTDYAPQNPIAGLGPADPVVREQFTITRVWSARLWGWVALAIRKTN